MALVLVRVCLLGVSVGTVSASAQTGSFIATLGTDTLQIERFERTGDRFTGIVVTRSPLTRVMRYTLTVTSAGHPLRYEITTLRADGTPLRHNGAAGSITWHSDSVTRETLRDGTLTSQRIATPESVIPGPGVPFLGTPFLLYELAHAQARRAAAGGPESAWHLLTMNAQQMQPQRVKVWLVGADSAESDYFGVARIGHRFNARGQLLRSDWSQSTYKYAVRRGTDIDVLALAREWDARDRAGKAVGPLSLPDTVRATIGSANLTVTYSRPAKRGRVIWGALVPWDQVWRLGADYATHLTTTADLTIGNHVLPAGRYTLWMLPSQHGESMLIINSRTNIFGTQYSPATDVVRIPLERAPRREMVERLSLAVENDRLWIRWDDAEYSAPIAVR